MWKRFFSLLWQIYQLPAWCGFTPRNNIRSFPLFQELFHVVDTFFRKHLLCGFATWSSYHAKLCQRECCRSPIDVGISVTSTLVSGTCWVSRCESIVRVNIGVWKWWENIQFWSLLLSFIIYIDCINIPIQIAVHAILFRMYEFTASASCFLSDCALRTIYRFRNSTINRFFDLFTSINF